MNTYARISRTLVNVLIWKHNMLALVLTISYTIPVLGWSNMKTILGLTPDYKSKLWSAIRHIHKTRIIRLH